jgi:hypothetical protein
MNIEEGKGGIRRIHLRRSAPIDREPLDIESFGDRPWGAVGGKLHRHNARIHQPYQGGPLR